MDSDVYKINPQLHNFRIKYGASAAIFQTEDPLGVLPPESWDIDEIGRTILPSCGPFVFLKTKFGCHLCDMNTYRKGDALTFPNPEDAYKRGGKCTSCPANTAAGLQSTKIEDCVSARGYNKVGNQACRICPANTYKSTISSTDPCVSCGAGYGSRSGSTDISKCVLPISIGQYETALPVYTAVLGLIYLRTPVESAWSAPPPIEQDQTKLCIVLEGGLSMDCGSGVYLNIYAQTPVLFGLIPNVLRAIEVGHQAPVSSAVSTNAQITSFHAVSDVTNRLHMILTPSWDTPCFVNDVDCSDYKESVKQFSLFPRPGYTGPSPPGFTEPLINGMQWIRGVIIKYTLRLRIKNNNLAAVNAGNDVYMVSFVSTRQLDTARDSLDWQWIVCGRKSGSGSAYEFCKEEADPDNPGERNSQNPHVLDGTIMRLNGAACCSSCYTEYDYMPDCDLQDRNPNKQNMYDNSMEWMPFINNNPPAEGGTFWLYTFFTKGESTACQFYNCNEAAVYRNMPLHLAASREPSWDDSIDFLPGTAFTYQVPMTAASTQLDLYNNILGFVAMQPPVQLIPSTGLQDVNVQTLNQMFTKHMCMPGPESTLTCGASSMNAQNNLPPVTYTNNMAVNTAKIQILEYVYSDRPSPTEQITYCCEVCGRRVMCLCFGPIL